MNSSLIDALEKAEAALDITAVPDNPFSDSDDIIAFCSEDINIWNEQVDCIEDSFNIKSTCGAGCGYCCHQLISVVESELVPIKEFMKTLPIERLHEILRKASLICSTLSEYGYIKDGIIPEDMDYDRLIEEYYKLHLYCPFLDEEKKCSIYPVRPGVCWAYRSYSDPYLCSQPRGSFGCICYSEIAEQSSERLRSFLGLETDEIMILPFAIREQLEKALILS